MAGPFAHSWRQMGQNMGGTRSHLMLPQHSSQHRTTFLLSSFPLRFTLTNRQPFRGRPRPHRRVHTSNSLLCTRHATGPFCSVAQALQPESLLCILPQAKTWETTWTPRVSHLVLALALDTMRVMQNVLSPLAPWPGQCRPLSACPSAACCLEEAAGEPLLMPLFTAIYPGMCM